LTELRAKHTQEGGSTFGVNGTTGKIADMKELNIWEPLSVKIQGKYYFNLRTHKKLLYYEKIRVIPTKKS
jgi:hypothetical protein